MKRLALAISLFAAAACLPGVEAAAQSGQPVFATTKVEGTDNVYVFRYGGHQSMFVTTPAGVIATDPISYGRPQAAVTYLQEIRKVTDKPVKYVVYSHHHYDHIAGGKPFKDAGAVFIAHANAKKRLAALKDPATVIPDQTFNTRRDIKLGGTTLELHYIGVNHSDSSLVMRLPKEKIVFAVDFAAVGTFPGVGMIDSQPLLWIESLKRLHAMQWDRLIPGHPGQPGGRLGTKQDVVDQYTLLQEASDAVKEAARAGKCWEPAQSEVKLPKYASWPGYEAGLPHVIRRYCALWGRGT